MATLNQDLYGLQYSADFSIQGLQEGDIDLSLPPVSDTAATVLWYRHRWHPAHCGRGGQAV